MIASPVGMASGRDTGVRQSDAPPTMTIPRDGSDIREIQPHYSKHLLFLPLVDRHGSDLRPRLAESWEHSPDYAGTPGGSPPR